MAVTSAPEKSVAPIVVPGQLTLRTIRGKNGPFTVGRLATHLGTFEVKDPELEQYPEGKYDGEFIIRYIFPKSYPVGGGMRFEIRASLDGMTLNGIDKLSRDEARSFATQDVDPLDEEQGAQPATTPAKPTKASRPAKPAPVQASWAMWSRGWMRPGGPGATCCWFAMRRMPLPRYCAAGKSRLIRCGRPASGGCIPRGSTVHGSSIPAISPGWRWPGRLLLREALI